MGASAAIRAEGLTKDYGNGNGLFGLDLEVRRGEVLGFLGPNGSGKSTTMRLLLDLIRPTAGSATVLGLDSRAGSTGIHRRVGYLPGDFALPQADRPGRARALRGAARRGGRRAPRRPGGALRGAAGPAGA